MMICPFLMAVNQFSGAFAITTYAVTVFNGTGSSIDSQLSSIVMSVLQVLATYVASQLVDRYGRKVLLLVSTLGGVGLLLITATYALLVEWGYRLDGWDWVPLVSISLFIFFATIGLLPVPYVMLAEVLPPKVCRLCWVEMGECEDVTMDLYFQIRRVGAIICSCIVYVCQSTMLKIMPGLLEELHLYGCMYVFAGVMLVGFVFTLVVVTETKGMNLDVVGTATAAGAGDDNELNVIALMETKERPT